MIATAALAGLEQAVNAALALDPKTGERLARLEGKVIAMELRGTGITLTIQPTSEGKLRLMGEYDGEVDTTLRGAPFALLHMATGRPGEGLFGKVEIEGDVELGTAIQRVFEKLDIDWEEHLSRLTGDIVAHQVGNAVRGLFAWGERTAEHLGEDVADYLQEEQEVLPVDWEVEEFITGVDTLRSDVDRIEARVKRLQGLFNKEP